MTKEIKKKPVFKPFKELLPKGLRVTNGIDTRGKHLRINYEVPSQLNNTKMYYYKNFSIGRYSYLRSGIVRNVKSIGRYCSIGPNVIIGEGEHPTDWLSTSPIQYTLNQFEWYSPDKELAKIRYNKGVRTPPDDIVIGNDVWIGAGAMIRSGVTIGSGAIVAGGSFVNKDVPPYAIVGGMPAKVLRYRFDHETITKLLKLEWWRFDINDLAGIPFYDIDLAIELIMEKEEKGQITTAPPEYKEIMIYTKGYFEVGDT
ncbi:MAG: CatB-related O-acetyltransferase [Gammaproteobacteria bacterium]|nr:CatB-related O-acetyltransferase [Gammaproteobacteria bacterium]